MFNFVEDNNQEYEKHWASLDFHFSKHFELQEYIHNLYSFSFLYPIVFEPKSLQYFISNGIWFQEKYYKQWKMLKWKPKWRSRIDKIIFEAHRSLNQVWLSHFQKHYFSVIAINYIFLCKKIITILNDSSFFTRSFKLSILSFYSAALILLC